MMPYRLVAASLCFVIATFFPMASADAQGPPGSWHRASFSDSSSDRLASGRIAGTVRTSNGHGISDAHIVARDVEPDRASITAQTDSSGSFALYNISPGTYEVTASNGAVEARERVQVKSITGESRVDFNLPAEPLSPNAGNASTVSLSQYRIPGKARSLYNKAVQYLKHGKIEESRDKVNAALTVCPKFSEALTLRAVLQQAAGRQTEAIDDFQHAIQYDADYGLAYIGLASVLNSSGRFSESLPILDHAERLVPNIWQTYFELARANIGRGQFAVALHHADRASELQGGKQKESPELHLVRGYALIGLNESNRAIYELETFLARAPGSSFADSARKVLDQLHKSPLAASK